MTNLALEQLRSNLRSVDLDFTRDPRELRPMYDAIFAQLPLPATVVYEASTVAGLPGTWCTPARGDPSKAVMYLHGGGYLLGSAHAYRPLGGIIAELLGSPVFILDYRLAPEHPYPAAVDDAITAYRTLLGQVSRPEGLALIGDSAGGGLALSLMLAARDARLALPASSVLWSPWVDLVCSGTSMQAKAGDDVSLKRSGLQHASRMYLRGAKPEGLAAPLDASLAGLPPLLIQVGSAEILLSDATRLAEACGLADVSVNLNVWRDMPHVFQAFHPLLEEGREAITQTVDFVRSHWRNL
jgi:acetyl esterase/lipase